MNPEDYFKHHPGFPVGWRRVYVAQKMQETFEVFRASDRQDEQAWVQELYRW